MVRKCFEVLNDGSKLELITGSAWAPQAKSFKRARACSVVSSSLNLMREVVGQRYWERLTPFFAR